MLSPARVGVAGSGIRAVNTRLPRVHGSTETIRGRPLPRGLQAVETGGEHAPGRLRIGEQHRLVDPHILIPENVPEVVGPLAQAERRHSGACRGMRAGVDVEERRIQRPLVVGAAVNLHT